MKIKEILTGKTVVFQELYFEKIFEKGPQNTYGKG